MNKASGKLVCLLLALSLLVTVVSGCGQGAKTPAAETSAVQETKADETVGEVKPVEQEAVTVKHFYNMSWLNDNNKTIIMAELAKRTGVTVEIQKPSSGDDQKLNIMVSSGELPDMITIDTNNPNVGKMIEAQQVYSVDELAKEAPGILQNVEPEYFQYHKYKDGKNYYFTNYMHTRFVYDQPDYMLIDQSFAVHKIREDIFETIGRPDMTSPDGFFNALMAIREKFPKIPAFYMGTTNGDELFNTYGFAGGMLMFSQYGLKKYEVADNKVASFIRSPKFVEVIKYLNKLYTNKLLAPEAFVDKGAVRDQKLSDATVAVFAGAMSDPEKNNSTTQYVPLPYFKGGVFYKAGSGWTATMVTKKTTAMPRVAKFIEYCTSLEGRQLIAWGIEGQQWQWDENRKPVYTPEWKKKMDTKDDPDVANWGNWQYHAFNDQYVVNRLYSQMTEQDKINQQTYKDHFAPDIFLGRMDPSGDSEEGIILAKLKDVGKTYYPKMIMAKNEIQCQQVYEEFLKKAEGLGLETLEKYWTAQYELFK